MSGASHLIEGNTRSYVQLVLSKCNENRVRMYSYALNGFILVAFILTVTGILWYCRSAKLTPKERIRKFRRDQEYVLTKIREFQTVNKAQREQFTRLVNRVETSEPIANNKLTSSNYVSQAELDRMDQEDVDPLGMPFSSMIPDAPSAPSYRDAVYDQAMFGRR
jgi:hypothetical protein